MPNPPDEGKIRQHVVDIDQSVYCPLAMPQQIGVGCGEETAAGERDLACVSVGEWRGQIDICSGLGNTACALLEDALLFILDKCVHVALRIHGKLSGINFYWPVVASAANPQRQIEVRISIGNQPVTFAFAFLGDDGCLITH